MIERIFTAYVAELLKAVRWKFTYVGPVLIVLMVSMAPLLHPVGGNANPFIFIGVATSSALNLLGLFLLISYCAGLVSSEITSGTIRLVLTRPLFRHEFIVAKLLTGATYAVLLTVVAAAASWAVAVVFGSVSGVEYGGEVVHTSASMFGAYALGALLTLAPQFAFVAYAIMVSTYVRNTGAAVITAIGTWMVIDAVKYPLGIAKYLFGSYVDTPWEVFRSQAEGLSVEWISEKTYWCLGTSAIAALIFSAIALVGLRRRNFNG